MSKNLIINYKDKENDYISMDNLNNNLYLKLENIKKILNVLE